MSPSLHVAFVATECVPFVKVGGLADVVGSLPKALETQGTRVDVIIPYFGDRGAGCAGRANPARLSFRFGEASTEVSVHSRRIPGSGVRVSMIEDGRYFPRAGVYVDPATGRDYPDQADRWAFFQQAALAYLERECPNLDVIHCHEHQTALIPIYLESLYRPRGVFRSSPVVLTIHNLGYQGIFPARSGPGLGVPSHLTLPGGPLEYYGQLNFMKGGILGADALTVVSPTYAREIQTEEFGYGLEGVIAQRRSDLYGILNGIDDVEWNPRTDTRIRARYWASDLEGKWTNRRYLLEELGLADPRGEAPLLGMVSRIDAHKGFDLVLSVLDDLLEGDVRFVLVGTGDRSIETGLREIANRHSDKAAIRSAFDDTLAHQVIAGADIFLMPSRYEPCGLTQMYALRYGTVPVVRLTGGLADTVREFNPDTGQGTGFAFSAYDPDEFRLAIGRAIDLWKSPQWTGIMRNGMGGDFSWTASARRYLDVYAQAIAKRRN